MTKKYKSKRIKEYYDRPYYIDICYDIVPIPQPTRPIPKKQLPCFRDTPIARKMREDAWSALDSIDVGQSVVFSGELFNKSRVNTYCKSKALSGKTFAVYKIGLHTWGAWRVT